MNYYEALELADTTGDDREFYVEGRFVLRGGDSLHDAIGIIAVEMDPTTMIVTEED